MYDSFLGCYNFEDCEFTDKNHENISNILDDIKRDPVTKRLIVPALWKQEFEHLLSSNFNLSKSILKSNTKRMTKAQILECDKVFFEQLSAGVIEQVDLEKD